MKPELILQKSMLDILFENRNREYGAYSLRKNYNKTMGIALSVTIALVSFAFTFPLFKRNEHPGKEGREVFKNETKVRIIELQKDHLKPPVKEVPKPAVPKAPQAPKLIDYSSIKIVQDNLVPTPPPTHTQIDQAVVSNTNNPDGENVKGIQPSTSPVNTGTVAPIIPEPESIENNSAVSVPAEFAGGEEALRKFLMKNLRVPDELEAGQTKRVVLRFVIDKDGSVDRLTLVNSAGKRFDDEVLRVVRLMPSWKPARQGDRLVAVYFQLPVVFTANEE